MGILISCIEATKQIIISEDLKLSRVGAVKLALHMNLCKVCRDFARQSVLVSTALKAGGPSIQLDPQFKEVLNTLIRENRV
jgi:hypothetical protein